MKYEVKWIMAKFVEADVEGASDKGPKGKAFLLLLKKSWIG
jgi:hypothetical protein